jgi:hypothetical protein
VPGSALLLFFGRPGGAMNPKQNTLTAGFLAVFNYEQHGIVSARSIVFGTDPTRYVLELATTIADWAKILVEHYAEEVSLADLEALHESLGEGEYPEDGWTFQDVYELVARIPSMASEELERSGQPWAKGTSWYRLIGFLNDLFPRGSGTWISIEGPFAESLRALLAEEAESVKLYQMSDEHAQWLGRLAVVAHWDWSGEIESGQIQALGALVDEFDERNEFR